VDEDHAASGGGSAEAAPAFAVAGPSDVSVGPDVLLFSGFLGSGKTTLIMALARELAAQGRKTAFIVNEVGDVGVDQSIMRDGGLEVIELTAGCICCTLGADLVRAMRVLTSEYRPRNVIVEASGLATPTGVLKAFDYYRGEPLKSLRSVGVLDPTRGEMLLEVATPLIESQIAEVDEIVITKVDEASEQEMAWADEVAARLNPEARVHRVSALDPGALARLAGGLIPHEDRPE
jgi:G3E family GTPase